MNDNDYMKVHFPDPDHLRKFPDDAYPLDAPRRGRIRISRVGVRPRVFLIALILGSVIGAVILLHDCRSEAILNSQNTLKARAIRKKAVHDLHAGFTDASRDFDVKTSASPAKEVAK
jgi:hypothetical protein